MTQQGIYEIVNLVDGKMTSYVGSSCDIGMRWNEHCSRLRRGQHRNPHLQAAFNKYGEGAFSFCVLEQVVNGEQLLEKEQYYLDRAFEVGNTYNIAITAGPGPMSEETKRKIGEAAKGKKLSEEHKLKISEALKGRKRGPMSEEQKRKLSKANKGQVPWSTGKTLSKEHRHKISKSRMGKLYGPMSENQKRKLSKAHMGKKLSTEHKLNMSRANKGKKLSVEHRRKISESLKQWWAKQRALKGV